MNITYEQLLPYMTTLTFEPSETGDFSLCSDTTYDLIGRDCDYCPFSENQSPHCNLHEGDNPEIVDIVDSLKVTHPELFI